MNIAFVVNELATEQHIYTTTWIAQACHNRGHTTSLIGVADFAVTSDNTLHARAVRAPEGTYETAQTYLGALRGEGAIIEDILIDALDVLMLRNDPGAELDRPWARYAGITYGMLAMRRGVTVLNDPMGMAIGRDKHYLQYFPEAVRPKTMTTRDVGRIRQFIREHHGPVVLKPTAGSGGRTVFVTQEGDSKNIVQMIEAISRDGYVIAQEYLPAIEEGDIRLFVMNGAILERDGVAAAILRRGAGGDLRNNLTAGAEATTVEVGDDIRELVEMLRPRLVQDGMFLVGLDIVGKKLMEINFYSPGGLATAVGLYGLDFVGSVVDALEHKVQYMRYYERHLQNAGIAIL